MEEETLHLTLQKYKKSENIENLKRPVTSKEIESLMKNPSTNKFQDHTASMMSSSKHLKKI